MGRNGLITAGGNESLIDQFFGKINNNAAKSNNTVFKFLSPTYSDPLEINNQANDEISAIEPPLFVISPSQVENINYLAKNLEYSKSSHSALERYDGMQKRLI